MKAKQPSTTPRKSSFVRVVSLAWFVLVVAVLLMVRQFAIPLGQGSFEYRLSEWEGLRIIRAAPVLAIAAIAWLALRRRSKLLAALVCIALAGWTFLAPPRPIVQHSFNLRSPSHEGAFVLEAEQIKSLSAYLKTFDQRLQRSPAEMMGTRVISNPPGMTIALYWLFAAMPQSLSRIEPDALVRDTIAAAVFLTLMWLLSAPIIYLAARQLLPAGGAMLATAIAWFNPSTVEFVPGKDPAQLLFVGLMLWLWLRPRNVFNAIAFGAVLAMASTFGLIFFWIAAAIAIAGIWHDRRAIRNLIPAAIGFFAIALLIDLVSGWNMLSTLLAVSHRYMQVQRELELDRTIWFFIGLPIFLLFVSPGLVVFAAIWLRKRRLNFGARLAIATITILLICYLVGVTYELPRLWVVFLPLLTIGFAHATPLAHARQSRKATLAMAFILVVQIVATAAHWSQLDVRESEYRLRTQRYFSLNSPPKVWPEWMSFTG